MAGCRLGRTVIEAAKSRWAVRGTPVGVVAGGPRFVRRRWSWDWRKGSERAARLWAVRWSSVGVVAGGPRFVRAWWSWHCRKGPERAVRSLAVGGPSVDRLVVGPMEARDLSRGAGSSASPVVVEDLPEEAAGQHWVVIRQRLTGGAFVRRPSVGEGGESPGFVQSCRKSCIAGSGRGAGLEPDGRLLRR
ncbi:hypothetical protein SAMN02744133_101317 [Thalassospira xiamenensis M-5 = DSM 17429]|nr:hypothetical protein SAMN02744133_101317 [Thalassospira xiamenensis M-5 = DSM 17429]